MEKHPLNTLVAFRTRSGYLVTTNEDIIYCKAEGNYASMAIDRQKHTYVLHNLKVVMQQLSEELFIRVHKSFSVNILHIKTITDEGHMFLILSDGHKIPVAHRKRQLITDLIKKLMNGHH